MRLTYRPLYKNTDMEFGNVGSIISSDYIQYSPYYYTNRLRDSENWSNERQNLLIFDIDDGMSIEEARYRLGKYMHLITTTKSHLQEKKGLVCDRYRIIMPATNIPRGEIYFKMLSVMADELPIDRQTFNKASAFLGNAGATNIYNTGTVYDCSRAVSVAEDIHRLVWLAGMEELDG